MKLWIAATLLAFAEAGIIKPKCVTIRTNLYEEELLKSGIPSPYQLAIDYDTSTLFFSYTAKTSETFKMAYLNLKTNDYGLVSGINGGFATTVDSRSHIVYMGGEDGVYTFDYDTKRATNLNIKPDANIWQMFYKDGVYFTTYPQERVFLYKKGDVTKVPEIEERAMLLAVKNNGNYVYYNSSGLFNYDKTVGKVLFLGDYTVNGFTADIDGNIYFSTPNAIYYIDDKSSTIEELGIFDNVCGIAIESNGNIIYAKEESIVRLKPTKSDCLRDNEINVTAKLD